MAAGIAGFVTHTALVVIFLTPAAFFLFSKFGLVGIVPAVICSWLSNKHQESVNA